MSAPRNKRMFAGAAADPAQRHITSFFGSSSYTSSSSSGLSQNSTLSPALPNGVQSNLLSVGMRIRKSVPEGYKTGGLSAFELWTDNPSSARGSSRTTVRSSKASQRMAAASNELLPFCGINRVGGLDTQGTSTTASFYSEDDDVGVPGLDDMPELTMSQETVDENVETTEPSRKRFFEDDEDGNGAALTLLSVERGLVSTEGKNARTMAVPRSRVKRPNGGPRVFDQENMVIDKDFDEADFLMEE